MGTPLVCATIGTFDGVHRGHQALLGELRERAKALGLRPAVVTFDPAPSLVLRPDAECQLLSSTGERVSLLRGLGFEDIILLNFNEQLAALTAEDFMRLLSEKYAVGALLLGYDHRFGRGAKLGFDEYEALGKNLGIRVMQAQALVDSAEAVSSSRIRQCLLSGRLHEANRLLARPYALSGQVVGGLQIGRSLGYPTANIKPDTPHKLIPRDGVYAVRVYLEGCPCGERYRNYPGMLYIGNRPTLGGDLGRTIEVNIFDFNTNLYAQSLRIEFIEYIRPNEKFDSLEALQAQIAKDEVQIRTLLGA